MAPADVIRRLHAAGIHLEWIDGDRLTAAPASCLTDELRELIRSHKPALLEFLIEAQATTAALIEAAMRACDHHSDREADRETMRADCHAMPPHLRADLLAHFQNTYGKDRP